jgi:hypothetical protein
MRRTAGFGFIFTYVLLFPFSTWAQSREGEVEPQQQVIIVKDRKIELPEAQRDIEKINIQKKTTETSKQEYSYNDYTLPLPLVEAKLKILSIKNDALPKLYANYLKGGLGNYATSYLEGFLYNKRSEKMAYGMNARYFSSLKGPLKNSGMTDFHMLFYGKYLMPKNILESELGYFRTVRQFYGYDQRLSPPKDSTKQVFNNFVWNIGLKNIDTLAKFTYSGNLELAHIQDRFLARETEGLLRYRTQMRMDENTTTGARGLISVSNRSDETHMIRNLIVVQPYYQKKIDKLTLTGGINFAYENDTVNSKKNFHLYPSAKAEYKVVEGQLTAFASLDGNMERNTLRTTLKENAWMAPRFALSHTNKLMELNVGAMGSVLSQLTYMVSFSYLNYKNLPFMVNKPSDSLQFVLAYDSSNVQVMRYKVDLTYNINTNLLIGASLNYQSFHMHSLKNHWHMPNMQTNYYVLYYFKEKIIFNLNSYMLSGIPALLPNGTEKTLPTIVDLNVKVDYLFSKKFSAFLELNNILANKYQRYLYYPVKGINFLAGATYSF